MRDLLMQRRRGADARAEQIDPPTRHSKAGCCQAPYTRWAEGHFNYVANWMKHGTGADEVEIEEWVVTMWLNRAISKYRAVYGIGTPAMTALFPWAGQASDC
jgi:hypothetical protein